MINHGWYALLVFVPIFLLFAWMDKRLYDNPRWRKNILFILLGLALFAIGKVLLSTFL